MKTGQFEVVVGVNGTGSSLYAVKWAATEVANRNGRLRLLYAWSPEAYAPVTPRAIEAEPAAEDATAEAARVLEIAATVAATMAPGVEVQTELVVGTPAVVLAAATGTADLLVLGDRGPSTCTGMLVGSVATAAVDHASCPILIVRGRVQSSGPVVVGVDGSSSDAVVLAAAFDRADRADATVVAVFASKQPGAQVLDDALAPFVTSYPRVLVERHVVDGSPGAALLLASAGAQLVVIGSGDAGAALRELLAAACSGTPNHAHSAVEVVRRTLAA